MMTHPLTQATRASLPDFLISGPHHEMALSGIRRTLPKGRLATLTTRAAAFFDGAPDGPDLLAGAVPYDRTATDFLFQPAQHLRSGGVIPVASAGPCDRMYMQAEPSPRQFRAAVSEAVRRIGQGRFQKIVLSRCLQITANAPFDEGQLLAQMRRDRLATTFSVPLPCDANGQPRRLIGATPELLVERRGRKVASHPLAGSARRSHDPTMDRAIGAALMASDKDRREHAMVAEMVLDTLAPYCDQLSAPDGMTLSATVRMWHLGTRIIGHLRDPHTSCAHLLAALHPTPAICGLPRDAADAALAGLEGYDRGFYAGAIGWLEASGDGCWYLALRCAELSGAQARLYAGAGIVAGSDPVAEESETSGKFLAMLTAFGLDERGTPLKDKAPAHD